MHSASISPAKPYEERFVKRFVGEDREECPICVDNDEFTYKSWVRLKACAHFFHQHCIDLWLEHKQTCPVCVQDVWGRKEVRDAVRDTVRDIVRDAVRDDRVRVESVQSVENGESSVSLQIVVNNGRYAPYIPPRFPRQECISTESVRCYCCVFVMGIVVLMATVLVLKS